MSLQQYDLFWHANAERVSQVHRPLKFNFKIQDGGLMSDQFCIIKTTTTTV